VGYGYLLGEGIWEFMGVFVDDIFWRGGLQFVGEWGSGETERTDGTQMGSNSLTVMTEIFSNMVSKADIILSRGEVSNENDPPEGEIVKL
jgi:hypothetical protein